MDTLSALAVINRPSKKFASLRKRWADVYYSTSLHTDGACPRYKLLGGNGHYEPKNYFGERYQEIFNNRLFSRHPREDELTREWRFSQYKPLTREPFLQLSELVLGTIFQDSNYSIQIDNEADRKFMLIEPTFGGYDLIGWVVNVFYGFMINDPNGYIVRMPKYAFNSGEPDNPIELRLVHSEDILFVSDDDFIFKDGNFAYHLTKTTIWRYTYDQKSRSWGVAGADTQGYYSHLLGRLPINICGGQWNSQGFFDSFYAKALPIADEFVSSYSAEQLVDKESSHPYIQQAQEKCAVCNGNGQVQMTCDDCEMGIELVSCNKCKGSGYTSINPGDRLNVPAEDMDKDLIRIISPNVGINTYHNQKNDRLRSKILDALNLLKTDEAQSGVAKTIDQAKLHNFIAKLSNHLFDNIIFNTIRDIIAYRNIVSIDGRVRPYEYAFSLIKPTQFQIKSSFDLLAEYKEAGTANMPAAVKRHMLKDFIDKQYSGDAVITKKFDLLDYYDPILTVPESEKVSKVVNGEIEQEDLIRSLRLPTIIDALIISRGAEWFVKTPIAKFEQIINNELEKYKAPISTYTAE